MCDSVPVLLSTICQSTPHTRERNKKLTNYLSSIIILHLQHSDIIIQYQLQQLSLAITWIIINMVVNTVQQGDPKLFYPFSKKIWMKKNWSKNGFEPKITVIKYWVQNTFWCIKNFGSKIIIILGVKLNWVKMIWVQTDFW